MHLIALTMNLSPTVLRLRRPYVSQYHRQGFAAPFLACILARCLSTVHDRAPAPTPGPSSDVVDAVVAGGGPAGVAVVGSFLELLPGKQRQVWADPTFQSGRVGARYREVPSNTKVDLFLQFAASLAPFRHIMEQTPEPNATTALRKLPQDQGCTLAYAADLVLMLTEGVARHFPDRVQQHRGKVTAATLNKVRAVRL